MRCPRTQALSALLDREESTAASEKLERHLASCLLCQHQWQALQALRQSLLALPALKPGVDLVAVPHRHGPARAGSNPWRKPWAWWPAGLGAGVALATGIWLGSLLGAGAVAPAAGAGRVFDPIAPGGLCAATELCRPRRIGR